MAPADEELLKFHAERAASFDRAKTKRLLKKHGNAFRYQLVAARHLDQWADLAKVTSKSPTADLSWIHGHEEALREVAERLRAGEYLPGGRFYGEATAD